MIEIPENYKIILDNLLHAEGGSLHRNKKELDVTNRYGIYRGSGRGKNFSLLWDYVDEVAKKVTSKPSKDWTQDEIIEINSLLDDNIIREHSYIFYTDYFRGAHLDLFPKELCVLIANLYTNSPKGTWLSIQEALRDLKRDEILDIEWKDLSSVDGFFGKKTRDALILFKEDADRKDKLLFKKSILLAMKSYYIDIAVGRPDKFLGFLNGWDNRMNDIEHVN